MGIAAGEKILQLLAELTAVCLFCVAAVSAKLVLQLVSKLICELSHYFRCMLGFA